MKIWRGITIHHTAGSDVSANEIDRWHKDRGWRAIGYHFVIRKNGAIEPGRPLEWDGAHARGSNETHIGIALTGNFEKESPTADQITSLNSLVSGIMSRYSIGVDSVDYHHERCPGDRFDRDQFHWTLGEA